MYSSNLDAEPVRPKSSHMIGVCRELAPVLHVNLRIEDDEQRFWVHCREIMVKLTRTNAIPDPMNDFALFVLFLYTFRELLKPVNVGNALIYALHFCPNPAEDFFVTSFVFAVGDPCLVVRAFCEMQEKKFPLWVAFMEQHGAAERLFDLFMSFLASERRADEKQDSEVKLHISKMLTDLVIERRDMVMWGRMAANLIKALNVIVVDIMSASVKGGGQSDDNYDHNERAVKGRETRVIRGRSSTVVMSFIRCILNLTEALLDAACLDVIKEVFQRICALATTYDICHNYCLAWMERHIKKLDGMAVAKVVESFIDGNIWGLKMVKRLCPLWGSEATGQLVVAITRMLTQSVIYMKLLANIVLDIFRYDLCDAGTREWFIVYLKYMFMFIRLAAESKRYKGRIITWAATFSVRAFMEIEWFRLAVLRQIRYCRSGTDAMDFLDNFVRSGPPIKSASWKRDFAAFCGYRESRRVLDGVRVCDGKRLRNVTYEDGLRFLPFISAQGRLFKQTPTSKPVQPVADPQVQDLEIPTFLKDLVFVDTSVDKDYFQLIFQLEDFLQTRRRKFEVEVTLSKERMVRSHRYEGKRKYFVVMVNAGVLNIQKRILSCHRMRFDKFKSRYEKLRKCLSENPQLSVDASRANRVCDSKHGKFMEKVARLKEYKSMMVTHGLTLFDHMRILNGDSGKMWQEALFKSLECIDHTVSFCPFSMFDDFVVEVLDVAKGHNVLKRAAACFIRGDTGGARQLIARITGKVIELLVQCISEQPSMLVQMSLVRYVFDQIYLKSSSLLFSRRTDDDIILTLCAERGDDTMESLGLSEGVIPPADMGCTLLSMGSRREFPSLCQLSFLTNPMDMVYHVYQTKLVLQALYPSADIDDIKKLFYVVMVASCPVNPASICCFVLKFGSTSLDYQLMEAEELFVEVCRRINTDLIL